MRINGVVNQRLGSYTLSYVEEKYGVQTKTFAMDFTKGDDRTFARLGEIINSVRVGVLVNNVGTNHDIPTPFDEESNKIIADIIEVNIKGALKMTKLVLPQMRSKYVHLYAGI